eukprot:m.44038 g.44038  ORF g.44038 m.44038 type:complete len:107 (+) comp33488_c0_seq1:146-466(+)
MRLRLESWIGDNYNSIWGKNQFDQTLSGGDYYQRRKGFGYAMCSTDHTKTLIEVESDSVTIYLTVLTRGHKLLIILRFLRDKFSNPKFSQIAQAELGKPGYYEERP